nr:MAG: hypothetical protein AM325_15410 [Candidatus Thorarchaeota archaeon SMTZ1-45]
MHKIDMKLEKFNRKCALFLSNFNNKHILFIKKRILSISIDQIIDDIKIIQIYSFKIYQNLMIVFYHFFAIDDLFHNIFVNKLTKTEARKEG